LRVERERRPHGLRRDPVAARDALDQRVRLGKE
jgi:hypothetical protein